MKPEICIHDDPRLALEAFLIELETLYYPWYDGAVSRLRWIWYSLHWGSLLIGGAASALAALKLSSDPPEDWLRYSLILLPLLGAFLSTLIGQSGVAQRYQLREAGRCRIQTLINDGRRRFAAAASPANFSAVHADLVKAVNLLESEQGTRFFSLASSAAGQSSKSEDPPSSA